MRIAVLSDTHSNYATIEMALQLVERQRVDLILHCGDIADTEAVWLFPPNTHFVFGNCDLDRTAIRQAVHGIGATLYEPCGRLELDGVRIFNSHGAPIGQIHLPERAANVCFGGVKRNRLFMAACHSIYALYVNTQGVRGG